MEDEAPVEKMDISIRAKSQIEECRGDIVVAGRPVAGAWGRDSGAKMRDGALLVSGSIRSGGSVKNWRSLISEDSVVKLINFPVTLIDDIDTSDWEILNDNSEIDREKLIAEKNQLTARLKEIENLLK